MPTCPWCNKTSRNRSKGCCPKCGSPVELYQAGSGKNKRKVWLANKPSTRKLVNLLENLIKRQLQNDYFTFGGWESPHLKAQFASAKVLIERCDFSQKLAEGVIRCYFSERRLVSPRSMHGVIGKQFPLALATAKSNLEKHEKELSAEQARVDQMEDVFDVEYHL